MQLLHKTPSNTKYGCSPWPSRMTTPITTAPPTSSTTSFGENFGAVSDYSSHKTLRTKQADVLPVGGGQGLTREEASHLTNRTSTMAPNNPDLYYTDLDVVHQLHCLDHIRHAMTNDTHYLHSASLLGEGHVWHCFEALRESLMCHSDISTIVRQWDPKLKEMKIRGDVAHTCRNFWKIHQWGKERALSPDGWDDGVNHDADDLEIDGLKIQEV